VVGGDGDLVTVDDGEGGVDEQELPLGAHAVPDPAQAQRFDAPDSRHGVQAGLRGIEEGGVDGVHEAPPDIGDGPAQHEQDGDGDQDADDRVGEGKPAKTPRAPITTASEVKPSVRACKPSATSAAEPIVRPTRMR